MTNPMTSVENATALSISQVAYIFVNRLIEFVNYLEESQGSPVRHDFQTSVHPLIQMFRNKDFPTFLKVLTKIGETELSSKKLERIEKFLGHFREGLQEANFTATDLTWNFFDGAFDILMSDIQAILDKPILQTSLFADFSRSQVRTWLCQYPQTESVSGRELRNVDLYKAA
jgi:hypothetical protein